MQLQLYMWSGQREHYLSRHNFYVEQVKTKVFAQFYNLETDADKYAEAEYARLGSLQGDQNSDMSEIADIARERSYDYFSMLSDLKLQMLLGGLAGLYHQWDKDLRDFIERELTNYSEKGAVEKLVWKSPVEGVFDVLREFGWDLSACDFFPKIDACRLIVNVYKHGKGVSLNALEERYPEYIDTPFSRAEVPHFFDGHLSHEWLSVTDSQVDEIAAAFSSFWKQFPERLYL